MHSLLTFLFGFGWSAEGAEWTVLAADLLALGTVPSVLLQRSGRPLAALSWVLALVALPFLGVFAWWLVGRERVARKVRSRRESIDAFCAACEPPSVVGGPLTARQLDLVPFAVEGARWTDGVFPPAGASVRVHCDGPDAFGAMETAVSVAQRQIRAEFYIWNDDETARRLSRLLVEKARQGVDVHILVDGVGGREFIRTQAEKLREAGAAVAVSMPPRFFAWAPTFNFRNHRKLLITDGEAAFLGGMNIGDEYAETWHDLVFELGGAVVAHLDDVFREDWFAAADLELPTSPRTTKPQSPATVTVIASGPEREENRLHDTFFLAITHAWQRVWLATPYFIPSPALMAALRTAAIRGVDVRIIVPRINDVPLVARASRTYYSELRRSGARVFEYGPRFSHTKAVVIDDDVTIIGSPNTDIRSFRLNFELACVVESTQVNSDVAEILRSDMNESVVVSADFGRRPVWDRLVDSAAHLLSPLL